jgi:nitrogenase-associated protein
MATIHFYEKPGCANNTRQKMLLSKAGHTLVIYDLLKHPWINAPEKLRSFFGDLPVSEWFNRSAPAIKYEEIDPDALDEQQAIELMLASPILIRRPLLEVDGRRRAGFDVETIAAWLGLAVDPAAETCVKSHDKPSCKP